jgi:hypothetical protein
MLRRLVPFVLMVFALQLGCGGEAPPPNPNLKLEVKQNTGTSFQISPSSPAPK